LLVPEGIPFIDDNALKVLRDYKYVDLAVYIINKFWPEVETSVLAKIIENSYRNFYNDRIVTIKDLREFLLAELYHGPTFAFKDLAMQFLGNLFEYLNKKRNININIIGATSGDTGSSAIYSVKGKANISIFILYPYEKISNIQELQMTRHLEDNIHPIAIKGNFDDCQKIIKSLFMEKAFKENYNLVAVNSINWARIVAQIVYYFYIYFQLTENNDERVNFIVPTGNFGNVFAGFMAKKMGLPIDKLVIATNENDILNGFVNNGHYSVKKAKKTYSPSMDITVASNFERYLYYLYEGDVSLVNSQMENLKNSGSIIVSHEMLRKVKEDFLSASTTNSEILNTIKKVHKEYREIVDPHTSCAINAYYKLNDKLKGKTICLATAHPAKFPEVVKKALDIDIDLPREITILYKKKKKSILLENSVKSVKDYIFNQIRK
ncbi:MAG: threonine synthase, partial [Deferribacterota bacterium]|nr:threonine synthase [Deferribacterota bacterium]